MVKAVIFDMFETLITHFASPLYFSTEMAKDAGISLKDFQALWNSNESARSVGAMTLEENLELILKKNNCYSKELLEKLISKRIRFKEECFNHLHSQIIPMLKNLKQQNILLGLISNCFSEEVIVIRKSILLPYFDAVYLSYEQKIQKPDEAIFTRCIAELGVEAQECLYVGDGGSFELETAEKLGMKALQAVWYLKDGTTQPTKRKEGFVHIENPMDIVKYL